MSNQVRFTAKELIDMDVDYEWTYQYLLDHNKGIELLETITGDSISLRDILNHAEISNGTKIAIALRHMPLETVREFAEHCAKRAILVGATATVYAESSARSVLHCEGIEAAKVASHAAMYACGYGGNKEEQQAQVEWIINRI